MRALYRESSQRGNPRWVEGRGGPFYFPRSADEPKSYVFDGQETASVGGVFTST